jgi:GT2 family glycosyltransferase
MNELDISVIVVNYNTVLLLEKCIDSLFNHIPGHISFEVFIVDNASTDGSQDNLKKLQRKYPTIQLIFSEKNSGFAIANNMAIARVKGRNTLLLNSDAYLIDESIADALAWIDNHPEAFGCGCRLLNSDLSNGISYGYFPELLTVFLEVVTCRRNYRRGVIPRADETGVYPVNFVMGAFYLIRTACLKDLGGFDETFFMYFEDVDLARRAAIRGLKTYYFGKTRVVHLAGSSSGKETPGGLIAKPLQVAFYQSWRYYLEKHCSGLEVQLVHALLKTDFLLRLLLAFVRHRPAVYLFWKSQLEVLAKGWVRR